MQSDNYDRPLNINEGTRLELGSTAKLRTLVTYLDIVEELHRQYAGRPVEALRRQSRMRGIGSHDGSSITLCEARTEGLGPCSRRR